MYDPWCVTQSATHYLTVCEIRTHSTPILLLPCPNFTTKVSPTKGFIMHLQWNSLQRALWKQSFCPQLRNCPFLKGKKCYNKECTCPMLGVCPFLKMSSNRGSTVSSSIAISTPSSKSNSQKSQSNACLSNNSGHSQPDYVAWPLLTPLNWLACYHLVKCGIVSNLMYILSTSPYTGFSWTVLSSIILYQHYPLAF